jgi:RNA polymerase sigma-70 factor (ECF subfamily)
LQKREAEKQFETLVREHELLIHKVCGIYVHDPTEREDLFQEIVIQLWTSYPRFRGQSKLSTWLYRVAINTAITGMRKRKHFIDSYEPGSLPQAIYDSTPAHEEEQLTRMNKAIQKLTQVEKAIVMLYMEDKSYEEMEEILGISQGNLRVKMNRVKEKLRQLTKTN